MATQANPKGYGPGEKPLLLRRRKDGTMHLDGVAPKTFTFQPDWVMHNSVDQPLLLDLPGHGELVDGVRVVKQEHVRDETDNPIYTPRFVFAEGNTILLRLANATLLYDVTYNEDGSISGTLRSQNDG